LRCRVEITSKPEPLKNKIMNYEFSIKHGNRIKKFDSALEMDKFIKETKLPINTKIYIRNDRNKTVSTLLVKKYLSFSKIK